MRDKGFYCGLLVLDMDRGGEVCFAEKNIRQYLTDNENSETFTRLRKYITRPSFEVKTENDWNDGGNARMLIWVTVEKSAGFNYMGV